MLTAWLALLIAQESIEELINQLRSGTIEARERAVVELTLRGEQARKPLEEASLGNDAEVAGRARTALVNLSLVAAVTPRAEAAFPGLRTRLAAGKAKTELPRLLLQAPDTLSREDLLPFARQALEFSATNQDRIKLLDRVAEHRLDSAVPAFAAFLDVKDWTFRQALFDAIDSCRARVLIPELLRRLATPHHDRWIWASPLARLRCRELVPILVAEILTPTDQRGPSVPLLVELDAVEAVPALLRRALEVDSHNYHDFLQSIEQLAPQLLRPALLAALEDPDPNRRRRAWTMLVDGLQSRSALPILRKRLDDPNPHARADAAEKLGRFRRTEFIPDLRNRLEDPIPSVRRAAALSLAWMGRKDGIVELLPALEIPQYRVPVAAALAGLGGHRDSILRVTLGPKPEHEDRHWLATHLAAMGAVEARPLILELLESRDELARRVSTWSLAKLDGVQALPTLRKLMKNMNDMNVAWSAFGDMVELLPAEAILDDIRAWTRHEDIHTRNTAINALLKIRRDEAVPLLLRELSSPQPVMRSMSAWTCGYHRVNEAIPRLLELLRDREARQAAGSALLLLGRREGAPYAEHNLNALNLLRHPMSRILTGGPITSFAAFLERTGLKVEGEDDAMRVQETPVQVEGREFVRVFLDLAPPGAVLEDDRVRLLNPREARRFWKRWLAEEKLLPDPERALAELAESREIPPLEDGATTRLFLQSKNPALAAAALRSAMSPEEIAQVLGAAAKLPGIREQLPPLLKHSAVNVRLAAARALLLSDEAAGVPLVVPLLDDPAAKTEIVKLLASLERREANAEILKRMDDPAIMWGLAWSAGQLRIKEAMPALLKAIEPGEYYFGRMFAVYQIRQLGDPSLAPRLREALRIEKDPQVTFALLTTLGGWGHSEAVPEIIDTLKKPRMILGHYAGEALRVLDQLGAKDVPLARALLERPETQEVAAQILADWNDTESLPALRQIPRVSDVLGKLGDRDSVPLLRTRLDDENHMTVWAAARALAILGDRPSFPRILADEDRTDTWRLLRTHEARTKLAGKGCEIDTRSPQYLPLMRPWLSHANSSLRARATLAVGGLDGEEALELTRGMLKDPEDEVRRAAELALGRRAWVRLKPLETPFYGPASELVERVAKASGLSLVDLPGEAPEYRKVYVRVRPWELPMAGADVVNRLPQTGWRLVLEGDALKVRRSER